MCVCVCIYPGVIANWTHNFFFVVCISIKTHVTKMEKMWIFLFALIGLSLYFWCTFIALAMFEVKKSKSILIATTRISSFYLNLNCNFLDLLEIFKLCISMTLRLNLNFREGNNNCEIIIIIINRHCNIFYFICL